MQVSRSIRLDGISAPLLAHLESRDAAIWIMESFADEAGPKLLSEIVRLPWRLVLTESSESGLLNELDATEDLASSLVRRRGFVQVIDTNPADVVLPPRSLPVYLLNGREGGQARRGLAATTRRLTMLDTLRRQNLKELVILSGHAAALPSELSDLWVDGFRTTVTVVSNAESAPVELENWRKSQQSSSASAYLPLAATDFCKTLLDAYAAVQQPDRITLRIRNVRGEVHRVDVTNIDDPQHPLLANFGLIQERDIQPLQPDDLSTEEVKSFFSDASNSWRPYAAGLPWMRDDAPWQKLRGLLRLLDKEGPEASRIAVLTSEEGAGATTLARTLSWLAASEGYPTLYARPVPFKATGLEVGTYITRIIEFVQTQPENGERERHYEAPWLVVFDRMHWEGRQDEIKHFLRELQRMGRAVCILVVTGPYVDLVLQNRATITPIATLTHEISLSDALALGQHINKYLAPHGATRTDTQWRSFYEATALQADRGIAAFWIALSFWLPGHFKMNETIQAWIYRQFKENISEDDVRQAILEIAALSTERHPLPDAILPPTRDWPVTQKIEDIRKIVPALGLAHISREGDRFWALAHDIIGRFLLTALFYDPVMRQVVGLGDATNPEHLRFLLLRRISRAPALGLSSNRAIAEEFALSIFKIDPDHGHANFVAFWREALAALDEMPSVFRLNSRSFRHHTAVSRRRIASQRALFQTSPEERVSLLERAISDLRYAIDSIPSASDGETDLNLYNSLALAYQDLADELIEQQASAERVNKLQALAHDATVQAYRLNPDNSFVIETYARSLIGDARASPDKAPGNAIEVLNIVYGAMERDKAGQRRFALASLAEKAIKLLLSIQLPVDATSKPTDEVDALVIAIRALTDGVRRFEGMDLEKFPRENRLCAASALAHPLLLGNPQAVRLRYALAAIDAPRNFDVQLELLQSLQAGGTVFSPQMRLELALLYQQCGRHHEAGRLFLELRRLWREGEHYVEVPDRLRWLWDTDGVTKRQVHARVVSKNEQRWVAKVMEFRNTEVLFRPQEWGQQHYKLGAELRGFISFGHNGPFLRPLAGG